MSFIFVRMKTAYEMRISDWSSDVCSSDLLGATTMLGRADLIEIQMKGALANGEFTEAQLQQIPLFMLFYAGAGNTTALFRGIEAAKAKVGKGVENKG